LQYYYTTPIYYVNGEAHIGHAYTTFIADTLSRYRRLQGCETFFLTGTDEHGQKIEESAKKNGVPTKQFADDISATFRRLWDEFEISYDHFIRTTDDAHMTGVQQAFLKMFQKGDIYKGEYEGNYCVSCETFFPESQLIDDIFCPDCGAQTSKVKEESYFFRLSNYEKPLLEYYDQHDDFILPKAKRNEIINFVKNGLNDLSVTRTSFQWGVPLPEALNDSKHVMYVWLDALLNYVTALGYPTMQEQEKFWQHAIHIVGKDILRFHAIYWPAFLMSLELPLPKHIAAHGWWTRNGEKMSKSKGNVIHPREIANAYGVENLRYFMLREVPFGQDGDFSQRALIDRMNSDLSNDLGNLLNRIIGMSSKYSKGVINSEQVVALYSEEMDAANAIMATLPKFIDTIQLHRYLEELWKVLSIANKSIEVHAPWVKMKEGKEDEALALVALVSNLLARVALLLFPAMPKTATKIATTLGFAINAATFKAHIIDNGLLPEFTIQKCDPLFPKVEEPLIAESSHAEVKKEEDTKVDVTSAKEQNKEAEEDGLITIDQFFHTSLKVGTIIEASEVPKSKKLLLLQVDIGEEKPRQVVAGIKEFYDASALVQTQVCVVANLKPAKLMGLRSEGMLLAAKDEEGLALIRPEKPKKAGVTIG